MNDGVTYKNKSYSTWNAIYYFFIVSIIVVPLLTAIPIFLKKADISSALQSWMLCFIPILLVCILYSRGIFNLVPLWIKKEGNLLIIHYYIKLIFWSAAKEISLDIRAIERMDFIEPKKTIGAHPAVGIYTKHNQIIRIGVDKEIFEMLKDLYFSMQGVDNPNKVVQR